MFEAHLTLYRDDAHGRVLSDEIPDSVNMTVELCVGLCNTANFTLAGLEFGVQCCLFLRLVEPYRRTNISYYLVCGNEIINGGTLSSNQADCNMGCGSNATYVLERVCPTCYN